MPGMTPFTCTITICRQQLTAQFSIAPPQKIERFCQQTPTLAPCCLKDKPSIPQCFSFVVAQNAVRNVSSPYY